jgi:hypothetical protein
MRPARAAVQRNRRAVESRTTIEKLVPVFRLPILSLLTLLLAAPALRQATPEPDPMRTFLRGQMGFSASDLAALDAGRAVARQMKTRDPVDVNIFGAVRVDAAPEAFAQQLQNIDALERKLGINQVGKFHEPPQLADLDGLTLERDDFADLQSCRVGDCALQLPAAAIERFRKEVNWHAPDARQTADRVFRAILFARLETYRTGGLPAIEPYQDRAAPISVAEDFRLLSSPGDMPVDLPELAYFLRAYPKATLPGATNVFYWNKGEFGMKPTTRLNHLVIYPAPQPSSGRLRYVAATSQIYGNHYFSATLELRSVVDDPVQPGKRFYLFYTTKSRVSGLTSFVGVLIRPMVRSRARSGMERYLGVTKKVVEDAAR